MVNCHVMQKVHGVDVQSMTETPSMVMFANMAVHDPTVTCSVFISHLVCSTIQMKVTKNSWLKCLRIKAEVFPAETLNQENITGQTR